MWFNRPKRIRVVVIPDMISREWDIKVGEMLPLHFEGNNGRVEIGVLKKNMIEIRFIFQEKDTSPLEKWVEELERG